MNQTILRRLSTIENNAFNADKIADIWLMEWQGEPEDIRSYTIAPSTTGGGSISRMDGESPEAFRIRALGVGQKLARQHRAGYIIFFAER